MIEERFEGRKFNIPFFGLRLKAFYYPKMCKYKWKIVLASWDSKNISNNKFLCLKWWVLWFRFGWSYLSIQLEEKNGT